MRISDWSSDVRSSDLRARGGRDTRRGRVSPLVPREAGRLQDAEIDGDRRGPAAQPGREGPSPRDPGTDGGHRGAKGRSRRRDLTARAGHFEGMRNMSEPIIICGDGGISRTGRADRSRRAAGLFARARKEVSRGGQEGVGTWTYRREP